MNAFLSPFILSYFYFLFEHELNCLTATLYDSMMFHWIFIINLYGSINLLVLLTGFMVKLAGVELKTSFWVLRQIF